MSIYSSQYNPYSNSNIAIPLIDQKLNDARIASSSLPLGWFITFCDSHYNLKGTNPSVPVPSEQVKWQILFVASSHLTGSYTPPNLSHFSPLHLNTTDAVILYRMILDFKKASNEPVLEEHLKKIESRFLSFTKESKHELISELKKQNDPNLQMFISQLEGQSSGSQTPTVALQLSGPKQKVINSREAVAAEGILQMKPIAQETLDPSFNFGAELSDLEYYKAAYVLGKATNLNWTVWNHPDHPEMKSLVVDQEVKGHNRFVVQREYSNYLRELGIVNFKAGTSLRGATPGFVSLGVTVKDFGEIKKLAMQAESMYSSGQSNQAKPLKQVQPLNDEDFTKALEFLNKKTGFDWEIGHSCGIKYVTCTTSVFVHANPTWQEGQKIAEELLMEKIGLQTYPLATLRGTDGSGNVTIILAISNPYVIERMADLTSPQFILKDDSNNPKSLSSVSATLCVMLQGYTRKQLLEHLPNPEAKLPFPFLDWTESGLDIKLPVELVEDTDFVNTLQNFLEKEASPMVLQEKFGRKFVVKISLGWEEIRPFIEGKLGLHQVEYPNGEKIDTIRDIIRVREKNGKPFTPAQILAMGN